MIIPDSLSLPLSRCQQPRFFSSHGSLLSVDEKIILFFVEFAKVKLQLKGPGNKAQDLTDANKIADSEHIPLEVPNVKFDLDGCV